MCVAQTTAFTNLLKMTLFKRVSNSDPYSDVLCSEKCQTKKLLVCCKIFAFFKPFLSSVPQKDCSHMFLYNCFKLLHILTFE